MSYLHVSKKGDDNNEGTLEKPLKTISRSSELSQPGDIITVHEGIYRELVSPKAGGSSESERIVYQAAEGEEVVLKGSEIIRYWESVGGGVWKVTLPDSFFGEFNPYREIIYGDWFKDEGRTHHLGDVYLNGKSMFEVESLEKVKTPSIWDRALDKDSSLYTWYCESSENETTIWANFQGSDPMEELVEINVRKACFFPEKTGANYITVKGFRMCHAATQWAPPTAMQEGLIGPNWSKGWIIEDNIIHDSRCSGISLGKEGSTGQNLWTKLKVKHGTQRERETVFQAIQIGWSKENIGSHIVRNNTIYNCEQTGVCGHMGAVFSEISGNHIYNIHVKDQFNGAEIAGIKIHAPIDTVISNNHIHQACRGMWMDWQAQGTRLSGNLLYDNSSEDLFIEVSHGPYIVDNNILLSQESVRNWSQGGAYVHNLIAGRIMAHKVPNRFTHYHFPHSTAVAGMMTFPGGDDRWFNNIFAWQGEGDEEASNRPKIDIGDVVKNDNVNKRKNKLPGLAVYNCYPVEGDDWIKGNTPDDYAISSFPVFVASNLYYNGAEAFEKEEGAIINREFDSEVSLEREGEELFLNINIEDALQKCECHTVTTALLGEAFQPEMPFENPDGSEVSIDSDYLGQKRNEGPVTGPFESLEIGRNKIKIWSCK